MAKIAVIGVGYVGLTTAVGLANLGHEVVGIDVDAEKINKLKNGTSPIFEKDLEKFLKIEIDKKSIKFSTNYEDTKTCDSIFLCLPTPQLSDGSADISYVIDAVKKLKDYLKPNSNLIIKSTVPVNTAKKIIDLIQDNSISVVSNPEFLREGNALADFFKPDRIVIGAQNQKAKEEVAKLYSSIDSEIIFTDNISAEIIKYASNSYLAIRLSFVNELAAYAENIGADATQILNAMGKDKRIGQHFLKPGPGWGGMCFPKDVNEFKSSAENMDQPIELLNAALLSNAKAHARIVNKAKKLLGNNLDNKNITVWGLAFKANTDDTRFSPAVSVVQLLIKEGCNLKAFDPVVKKVEELSMKIENSIEASIENSDLLIVLTEWDEFSKINPKSISAKFRQKNIIDSRNILDKKLWQDAGFNFLGNGS